MLNLRKAVIAALAVMLMAVGAVSAESIFKTTFEHGVRIKGGLTVVDTGLTVSSGAITAPSISLTTPITNANVGNAAKRQLLQFVVNGGGTCADGTTYSALLIPGRAGVIKAVNFVAATPPVGGTNTLLAKKGSSSGNSLLSANKDATTLVANTVAAGTLTSTSADLAVTATQPIYVAYTAGTQSTDAVGVVIQVEFEPNDF